MADGRILSRRITKSDKVASLSSDTARMIYSWIIPYLDVEGRMEAHPKLMKGEIAPLLDHITPQKLQTILLELHQVGLIILYSIESKQYLQLMRFEDEQRNLRKDKEAPSRIPSIDEGDIYSVQSPDSVRSDPVQTPLEVEEKRRLREEKETLKKRFEIFWKTYPKKKSKGQAEHAFMKIKPDEQLLETMLSKIKQAKTSEDWIKEKGRYIPYPATWLNAKGWEDEIIQSYGGTDNGKHARCSGRQEPQLPADVQSIIDEVNARAAKVKTQADGSRPQCPG